MATNLSEPPGQPPGAETKDTGQEDTSQDRDKITMETAEDTKSSPETKTPSTPSKRKTLANESEDEDKSESLDDICRKKFKPIAPKPFLKKDQHQSVVMTAMPIKEGADIDKRAPPCVDSDTSPTKGAVIFMGPNMQLYPSAPFIVHPPPLVPCSGGVVPGGAYSFAVPTPVGHFVPHGFCPPGQYQTCCVRIPPPVIEGRDYYVNGIRPDAHSAEKDTVTKSQDSPKVVAKPKSQPALSSCSKESNKSKANRYKYSILYNGPIYKGPTPTGTTVVSSSPQSSVSQSIVSSVPPVDSFIPTTESDNAGNVKLSLPAVLTSTGVLQITVPSLRSIEPKRTNNPSAYPQIKLQTVQGAVLTPGVLPTVLSPQHHPNSGHVVVVSAHNQVSNSSQVSILTPNQVPNPSQVSIVAPNQVSRPSHVHVTSKPVPRVIMSTAISARTDSTAISRTIASTTTVVSTCSTNIRPVSSTGLTSSGPSHEQSTSSSSSSAEAVSNNLVERTVASDQSLHTILGGIHRTNTVASTSTVPATTVPNLINALSIGNIGNTTNRSGDPTLFSSESTSQTSQRVPLSASENSIRHQANTSGGSVAGNSQMHPRTLTSRTGGQEARIHSSGLPDSTPVSHPVDNQQHSQNAPIVASPSTHAAVAQAPNRTQPVNNNGRWASEPIENTNSAVPRQSPSARNMDESLRLGNQFHGAERAQVPNVATTSNMVYTGASGHPRSQVTSPRTVSSVTQQSAIPRMSTAAVGTSAPAQEQRQPSMAPSGHRNAIPLSDEVPPATIPGNISNADMSNQRSGVSRIMHTRPAENDPTSVTHQMLDTLPAALPRRIRAGLPQSEHSSRSIQVPNGSRNDSNGHRSDGNPSHLRSNAMANSGLDNNRNDARSASMSSAMRDIRDNASVDTQRPILSQQQYPPMSSRMPAQTQSMPPAGQPQQFPAQTPSTQSNQQSYSSSSVSSQEKPSGPPVVCVTSRNEFVRPSASSHRWPQGPSSSSSQGQVHPPTSISPPTPSSQSSYSSPMQSTGSSRSYPSNPPQASSSSSSSNLQMQQQMPSRQERSDSSVRRGFGMEDRNFETVPNSRFNPMQAGKTASRPWQNNDSSSGLSGAYGGLGLRGRPSSAGQLADSEAFMTHSSSHQHTDRFRNPSANHMNDESDLHVQTVPLHSNVPANTRQVMNDVINRRATKPSRPPQRISSDLLTPLSDNRSDQNVSSGQGNASSRTYESSTISSERTQSDISASPHSASSLLSHGGSSGGMIHSDSMPHLPVPVVHHHPMLYGNSATVPNLSGLHPVPLPGGLGSHSVPRPQHPLTPPPPPHHQTPPRPSSHMHNHMFVPPPYASMHRPLYMPAPSPRPPDIGLMSPRTYGHSHIHDSGLYSPRIQSMQSSSSLADSILSSHLARTFSDDRLDTCCSGMHAHSPPAPSNARPILPPGFSSPTAPSFGHLPPSPIAAASFNSNPPPSATNDNSPHSAPPTNSSNRSVRQQHSTISTYQRSPQAVMPSDIFGPTHLERVAPSMMSHSSSSTGMSNPATCVASSPSVPAPLTVQTNLNMPSNTNPSTNSSSSSSTNLHSSDSASVNTPTGTSHNSPPTSVSSPMSSNSAGGTPLPARSYVGNTSDKYLPVEETTTPTSGSGSAPSSGSAALNSDQVVKGDVVLQCSRQILRESGRTVLCCWHCDYHTAEPKKMYRHQKKDSKSMKCQLCDFKGYSRCTINQHFKEKHMDKL